MENAASLRNLAPWLDVYGERKQTGRESRRAEGLIVLWTMTTCVVLVALIRGLPAILLALAEVVWVCRGHAPTASKRLCLIQADRSTRRRTLFFRPFFRPTTDTRTFFPKGRHVAVHHSAHRIDAAIFGIASSLPNSPRAPVQDRTPSVSDKGTPQDIRSPLQCVLPGSG